MSRDHIRTARAKSTIDLFTWIVLGAFIVVAGITAILGFTWARGFFASWTLTSMPGDPLVSSTKTPDPSLPTAPINALSNQLPAPLGALDPQTEVTPVPWDGSSRVTILIMGLDYRDWSEGRDVPRTDSMILLSIDPLTKTAGVLSIPRDLWVAIPGMENNKINTAYRWGEIYQYKDGGPGLAMKTVEGVVGVPIQYYALIDFNSFVQFIDSLGGLDMKIREEITVDPIGPGNTITIKPGTQTLNGEQVLAYARERHQGDGDFSRSQRQQEVIMAIRKQILTLNMLPTLIAKSPALYEQLKAGIRTNLTLNQVVQLAWLGSQIKEENIKKGVFDPHKDVGYGTVMTPDGIQDILIPNPDQIRILRDQIFATSGPVGPASIAEDPAQLMKTENAKVRVLNGSSTTGAAAKAGDMLKSQQVNITDESNADKVYGSTTIIDYTGKPYTINFLIKQMGIENPVIVTQFDANSKIDVDLIVAQDWAAKNK